MMKEKGDKMNFHDKVYELVKALKETYEYKNYLTLKQELKNNNQLYEKLKRFKEKQQKHHLKYLNSETIDEKELQEMQDQYTELTQNELCRQLFEAEMRINVLLGDMQKIVATGIKELNEF